MLVAAQVSSMNTRWLGSSAGWRRIKARRASATSGRSCSAACRLFFARDLLCPEKPPHTGQPDRDPVLGHQRAADLLQGQVWLLGDQLQYRRCAPASVSGDRRPSRVLGHDPRLATAAPSQSPCSRSPQTDPPLLAPMFPMLPPRPRDRVNPPNMVPAHRPPTICCLTTIADPHLLGNLLSGRIYPVGNRSNAG